jgi:hypothetical protein
MEFSLYEHDFESEPGLSFEDYRYEAVIRTPVPDNDFRTLQVITVASLAYALFRRLGVCEGILVHDTDLLLARYEGRAGTQGRGELYDSVSGEVVKFPRHILSLMERVPKATYP